MPNFDSMVCDLNNSIVTSTTYAVAFSLLEISNGDMVFVVIFLCIVLHGGFSSIGVISNGFSLLVFKRQGLKDSMTVGLFSLSLSDFLACLISACNIPLLHCRIDYPGLYWGPACYPYCRISMAEIFILPGFNLDHRINITGAMLLCYFSIPNP